MAVDIGELGLLIGGIGTPVAVAAIGALAATLNARRSNRTEEKRLDVDEFAQFREAYNEDMKRLRDEVAELRTQFNAVRTILRRTREAFREYIRQVRSIWGTSAAPPPLSDHIRDLLSEDDLDGTFSTDEVRRMRDGTDLDAPAERG
jgi:hypothetical protein